ncbi:MAG: tRNA (adenosine(37)-N6)-threonylcarbamoyltransferase complex transferase subunit TsaD [Minisyncoccia bacterium]
MLILGIETSCDETAIAFLSAKKEKNKFIFTPLSNIVSSQIKIHRKFGGVVPKLACRAHSENIDFVLKEALKEASGDQKSYKEFLQNIDLIATTNRPGLEIALLIGVNFARALSWYLEKPLIGVSHLEGHLLSFLLPSLKEEKIFLEKEKKEIFPALALIVSGGHTLLVAVKDFSKYKIIGQTLDDAAGECFDKGARILGLKYPGGPEIAKLAKNFREKSKNKKEVSLKLPRPMINSSDFNFSFSGLKTALLYTYQKLTPSERKKKREQLAYELEEAITDVLVKKSFKAIEKFSFKSLILGGGVSANQRLREKILEEQKKYPFLKIFFPQIQYSLDNALMIALAGFFNYDNRKRKELILNFKKIKVEANKFF